MLDFLNPGSYEILNINFQTFFRLHFSEWHTHTATVIVNTTILQNKILSECIPKDQVWKIISIFHANFTDQKNFLRTFYRLENDQTLFHTFQDSVDTLFKLALLHRMHCAMHAIHRCFDETKQQCYFPFVLPVTTSSIVGTRANNSRFNSSFRCADTSSLGAANSSETILNATSPMTLVSPFLPSDVLASCKRPSKKSG